MSFDRFIILRKKNYCDMLLSFELKFDIIKRYYCYLNNIVFMLIVFVKLEVLFFEVGFY